MKPHRWLQDASPPGLSPRVATLVELIRQTSLPMPEPQRFSGLSTLRSKMQARRQRVVRAAQVILVAAAGCAVAVTAARRDGAHAPISFRVEGAALGAGGTIQADSTRPALVRFGDGSEVSLDEKSRVRVRALSEHGARVALDEGRAHVSVVHTPETRWSIEAGPFVVAVTGTAFGVSWSQAEQRLEVQLESGAVTVTGPLPHSALSLRAGQWLIVRASDVLVRDFTEVDASPAARPLGPSSGGEAGEARPTGSEGSSASERSTEPLAPRPDALASGRAHVSAMARNHHWPAALAAGRSERIVEEALRIGLDSALAESQSEDLAALGDAARYTRHHDIARSALLALRQRFPTSEHGRVASFLLGRLSEADDDDRAALSWFESYLADAPNGRFASEALGRKMNLVQRHDGNEAARPLAAAYLRRFPDGTYAEAARALTRTP